MSSDGICYVCRQARSDLEYAVLGVIREWTLAHDGKVEAETEHVECLACAPCYRRGRWIVRYRILMIFVSIPLFLAGIAAVNLLSGSVPEPVVGAILVATLVAVPAWIVASPFVAAGYGRRAMNALFAPETNAELLRLSNVERWGMTRGVGFIRRLPEGASGASIHRRIRATDGSMS